MQYDDDLLKIVDKVKFKGKGERMAFLNQLNSLRPEDITALSCFAKLERRPGVISLKPTKGERIVCIMIGDRLHHPVYCKHTNSDTTYTKILNKAKAKREEMLEREEKLKLAPPPNVPKQNFNNNRNNNRNYGGR
ncbi:MAG: hypothetical protein IKV03_05970 [Alphaproteobacteria bacterium]|nr:hypothetical protein [Alphaproteobacteria bacterium]